LERPGPSRIARRRPRPQRGQHVHRRLTIERDYEGVRRAVRRGVLSWPRSYAYMNYAMPHDGRVRNDRIRLVLWSLRAAAPRTMSAIPLQYNCPGADPGDVVMMQTLTPFMFTWDFDMSESSLGTHSYNGASLASNQPRTSSTLRRERPAPSIVWRSISRFYITDINNPARVPGRKLNPGHDRQWYVNWWNDSVLERQSTESGGTTISPAVGNSLYMDGHVEWIRSGRKVPFRQ